ncbi:MAG TPA: hypothetical protein VEU62_13330 [Bryobacterales bacterium]|nr:hypothetical protein [Bryobacterales bacterium]
MKSPLLQADLLSALSPRFGSAAAAPEARWPPRQWLLTGIPTVDSLTGGLPRGAITEICGGPSSGRTSLLVSVLAQATARREVCALLDSTDAFDPASAAQAGVDLESLLWVRCAGRADHALTAADWLLQGGGFGVVAFDLAGVPPATTRRISLASWFRLRRAIEHTPTILLVLAQEPQAKSCSSLILEARSEKIAWTGSPSITWGHLLRGTSHHLERRKPLRSASAAFHVCLWEQAHSAG